MYFSSGNWIKEMYPFLALFLLVVIPSICKGQPENSCNVFPKDQYIEVGSDTEIVCRTSCVHGKIFWTLNNRRINESLYTINSSHTVLSLRNFTHYSATLQCHSEDTQQVLGGTTVKTYSKPRKISCLLHYYSWVAGGVPSLFTCNWEHQIHSSLEMPMYQVLCVSPSCHPPKEICKSNATNCQVHYENSGICLISKNNSVAVRAKTTAWEATSDHYEFDPYHILKMISPSLTVTTGSDHLLVKWTRQVQKVKCHCQVKYYKAVNERTPEFLINKTLDPDVEGNVTIKEVESCSYYNFSVRCALDMAPWSDWSQEETVLTKLNKSNIKLRLWRKVGEPDKNGIRKVHAMWTEIPSTCQGTFSYTIKTYEEHMTGKNDTVALCGNSTCEVDVNQDAHRIKLTVFRNEILLVEESVYVPATGESLPQVTDIQTSTHEGVILVKWKAPVQPVSGYMIDCTHNGNQYYWMESKYTNATLLDLLDKKPYNITVTPLFDDKTGHGTQALQICSRVGDPGNVSISVQAYDKSASVSLNVSQEACSGVLVNYTVFYGTQKGPQLNVTVNGTVQDIYLKDLNPDTEYSVYVKATALTGATKSSERHFKTKRFDPRLITILSVCGSIFIVLVLCFGLCCAIQWNKFKEKPVPNPGLGSLAVWPSRRPEKEICPFQPFSNPSQSPCDRVYIQEDHETSTTPIPTDWNSNRASDQIEDYTDIAPAPNVQNEVTVEPVQEPLSSPGESTALLFSDNSLLSPYRSQSSVEGPAPKISKQSKQVPVKQQEKTAPVTVYVTLDMFEQGQDK